MEIRGVVRIPMLALLAAAACSNANILGPANQVQVVNDPGTFEWQATALDGVRQTVSYQWVSNDTVANVNQASSVTGGSATLSITDATGAQLYERGLDENGTFATSAGVAGTWTVVVSMSNVSGALNFRIDNP